MVNLLYVNGCSHTAAAEAVVPECFAVDDGRHGIDRRPHPENLKASWCTVVGQAINVPVICDAESGGSNPRILRTTRQWISNNPDKLSNVLMILQWTTWERQEWYYDNRWYQVNASGWDWVPEPLQQQYRQFVIDVDWNEATNRCHREIWQLHRELTDLGIKHLFYSGHSTFSDIETKHDWGASYMEPYNRNGSYNAVLKNNNFDYVNPKTFHFGAEAHRFWGHYVLQYLHNHNFLTPNEISPD
jgi:hypothetical protein